MTETTIYYRTNFGSHKHASDFCANARRDIGSGDIMVIPAAEVADWAPCLFCCTPEAIAASAKIRKDVAATMCPNTGTKRPGSRRLYDDCKDCGKNGKVLANGCLKAHKPQA